MADEKQEKVSVSILNTLLKNQTELAATMQQLLTGIGSRLENIEAEISSQNGNIRALKVEIVELQARIVNLENRVVERDVRAINRNLRSHVPFTFTKSTRGTGAPL
jgi:peptidoglycan hydrolase CwlO-like protein